MARRGLRTSYEPNRILMRENKGFFSFAFDSAHVKYGPNAIYRINQYPTDSVVCFVKTYPLDSDLSSG